MLVLALGCGAKTPLDFEEPEVVEVGEIPGVTGPLRERPRGVDPEASFWIRTADDEVDLLFLVDDSAEMGAEQAFFVAAAPSLVTALARPEDDDDDGQPDYPVAGSVQIGFVSSDMGTSRYPVASCEQAARGDDGVLQHAPSPAVEGCDATYPAFLTYEAAAPDPEIALDIACIGLLGTGGCGFEQPLAAVDKAVGVHARPAAPNDGFLRSFSLLAVVLVTEEDDCSVRDPQIFSDRDDLGPLNLRCSQHAELLEPVDGFVSRLLELRSGRPDRIVAAGLVGVPPDVVELSGADLVSGDLQSERDFDAILRDPRMQEEIDYSPAGGGARLVPSCDVFGIGLAFPPRRMVEWVRSLDSAGAGGLVQSICQHDLERPMRAVAREIQNHLQWPDCTSSPLVDAAGREAARGERIACALFETDYNRGECDGPARVDRGIVGDARVCEVCQLGDGRDRSLDAFGLDVRECPGSDGWTYEPNSRRCPDGGRIVFTTGSEPRPGRVTYLECRWPPG